MLIEFFSRREQKDLFTRQQYEQLVERIMPRMRDDKYGLDGKYDVTSLYFDKEINHPHRWLISRF